jgi:hypothetical protein
LCWWIDGNDDSSLKRCGVESAEHVLIAWSARQASNTLAAAHFWIMAVWFVVPILRAVMVVVYRESSSLAGSSLADKAFTALSCVKFVVDVAGDVEELLNPLAVGRF